MKNITAIKTLTFIVLFNFSQAQNDGIRDFSFAPDLKCCMDVPTSMTFSPDGKIILVGGVKNPDVNNPKCVIARVNTDGTMDASFGVNGFSIITLPASLIISKVISLGNGKILIGAAGKLTPPTQFNDTTDWIAGFQLNLNGTLDVSFGQNGYMLYSLPKGSSSGANEPTLIDIQPDGKIVVARSVITNKGTVMARRFLSNGMSDGSFGTNGMIITENTNRYINDLKVLSDGMILLAGTDGVLKRYMLIKLNSNGTLNNSLMPRIIFYMRTGHPNIGNGISMDWINRIGIQNDGKIIWTGASTIYYSNATQTIDQSVGIAKLNSNGMPDITFGDNGWKSFGISDAWGSSTHPIGASVSASPFLITPDNKIIVADFKRPRFQIVALENIIYLYRFLSNGTLDATFGNGGIVADSSFLYPIEILLSSDGYIYVCGAAGTVQNQEPFLARYHTSLTGIMDKADRLSLSVFPNPTSGNLQISYDITQTSSVEISLYDLMGKKHSTLFHSSQSTGEHQLELSFPDNLPHGTYMLSIKTDEGIAVKKILKM